MSNVDFWKGAGERAAKTFAQAAIATLGLTAGATYTGADFLALPWETALITAAVATVLSFLTSLTNASFTAGSGISPMVDDGMLPPSGAYADGEIAEPELDDEPEFIEGS